MNYSNAPACLAYLPPSDAYDPHLSAYGSQGTTGAPSTVQQTPYSTQAGLSSTQPRHDPYSSFEPYDPYAASSHDFSAPSVLLPGPAQNGADAYSAFSAGEPYGGPYSQPAQVLDQYRSPPDVYAPAQISLDGYAPSESLSNGHVSSDATRPPIPVATFGFNGRLVTFFPLHAESSTSAAYASPYGKPNSTGPLNVTIRKLSDLLTTDATALEAFPGPLFMDQGTTSAAGKAKKKKETLAWLDERIKEAEKESSYVSSVADDPRKRDADEKGLLHKLIRIMLDNDGKLVGSPEIDKAVRAALLPQLAVIAPGSSLPTALDLRPGLAAATGAASATDEDLDAIEAHLLQGDKREAVKYALDRKLWAHALVIAAGVDKELAASVTREFVQNELQGRASHAGGREPLKVAYSLLTGAGGQSSRC